MKKISYIHPEEKTIFSNKKYNPATLRSNYIFATSDEMLYIILTKKVICNLIIVNRSPNFSFSILNKPLFGNVFHIVRVHIVTFLDFSDMIDRVAIS